MAADLGCSSLNQSRVIMVVIYGLFKSEDGSAKEALTMASEQSLIQLDCVSLSIHAVVLSALLGLF